MLFQLCNKNKWALFQHGYFTKEWIQEWWQDNISIHGKGVTKVNNYQSKNNICDTFYAFNIKYNFLSIG